MYVRRVCFVYYKLFNDAPIIDYIFCQWRQRPFLIHSRGVFYISRVNFSSLPLLTKLHITKTFFISACFSQFIQGYNREKTLWILVICFVSFWTSNMTFLFLVFKCLCLIVPSNINENSSLYDYIYKVCFTCILLKVYNYLFIILLFCMVIPAHF